jgi:hypothetical protein
MKKSESIKNISTALAVFHIKMDVIKKDAKNPFFKSTYASLSNILDAIKIPLAESDLSFSQHPMGENGLSTILMHKSGEWIGSHFTMKPMKNDPQGIGSCITYMRRYALAAILGLNIDEDDDGNQASGNSQSNHKSTNNSDKAELPWLNKDTKEFSSVLAYLIDNGTMDKVRLKYKVSKEVETLLLSNIKK